MKENVLKLISKSSISLEKIQKILNIEEDELKSILKELTKEHHIFLNTSKNMNLCLMII